MKRFRWIVTGINVLNNKVYLTGQCEVADKSQWSTWRYEAHLFDRRKDAEFYGRMKGNKIEKVEVAQ